MVRRKIFLCVCIVLVFITSGMNAATFQWLGSTSPESYVGQKYTCVDSADPAHSTINVGQGVYSNGQLTDVVLGQTEDTLSNRDNTVPCKGYVYTRTILGHTITTLIGFEPILPPTGSYYDYTFSSGHQGAATAISADGSTVVGVIGYDNGNSLSDVGTSFRWTESEGMSFLLPFPGAMGWASLANDVSANGDIIVGWYINHYSEYLDSKQAFIWDTANGWQNLTAVVSGQYNIDLGSCRLTDAIGISDDGTQIVGYGLNSSGVQEGWILTIPEPATILLLTLGGLVLRKKK